MARILFALLAVAVLTPLVQAQTTLQTIDNRWLLIFDTSAKMKKCLPTTQKALTQLFLSLSMDKQLQSRDTVGVWTFSTVLDTGRFPLQVWEPEIAEGIASNITLFVRQQSYTKTTRFESVVPLLNRIVQNSDRLTVLIFCDGDGQIQGTPYDSTINAVFEQNRRTLQRAKQPFIVALRSQFGQYVGCKISSPPAPLGLPEFPPLPEPPEPPPALAPTNESPSASPVAPSLVIVGTNVGVSPPTPESKPQPANPPAQPAVTNVMVIVKTNFVSVESSNAAPPKSEPTNPPAMMQINPPAKTNAIVASENSGPTSKKMATVGAILLVAAGALTALVIGRSRRSGHGSLITRSMNRRR